MSFIAQFFAAAAGSISLLLLFGAPARYYPHCGLIGGTGWLAYILCKNLWEVSTSIFLASVLIALFTRFFAERQHCPSTVFLVAGLFPLVPGAGIYWTAYYTVINNVEMATETGFLALKMAVAIVLGVVLVFELPRKLFQIGMKEARQIKRR